MNRSNGLVILNARQIVTLSGPQAFRRGANLSDVGARANWAMVCRGGLLEWTGPASGVGAMIQPGDEIVDASNCSVLPGFVDAHTHPVYGGDRLDEFSLRASGASYQEIAAAGGGILSTVSKTRAASEQQLIDCGIRHAELFLRNGTTTIEAKSGYGLNPETEIRLLGAIKRVGESTGLRVLPTYLGAHAIPAEFAGNRQGYMDTVLATLDTAADQRLALWSDIFVESGYFDAEDARRLAHRAKSHDLGLRMHVDQFGNSGGARLAAELAAASADHLEYTDIDGISALAKAGVTPVLLPASVYCLGLQKYPLARTMVDHGLPIVVATDFNPGSSPTLSMPFVMSLCCTQMRLSPEEALTASTINPAYLLGLGDKIGSLEAGKVADFTLWQCNDWREIIYHVGSTRPSQVFCGGKAIS